MIKTIILDFGEVFLNLDQEAAMKNALKHFKMDSFSKDMVRINEIYEQGLISTYTFLEFYCNKFPDLSKNRLISIWNFMLKDFPRERLDFLKKIKATSKFKLILLSNTNELHIDWVKKNITFYNEFKDCFDAFYLSHEINLRKPNTAVFEFILSENHLKANECLFIDDNPDNTNSAEKLGINIWNLNPKAEDITNLFKIKSHLFD